MLRRRLPAPAASAPVAAAIPPGDSVSTALPNGLHPSIELLTPQVVAARLSVAPGVLERMRANGTGPRFVRLTRKSIRYRSADVEAFIASRVFANTAAE